MRLQLSASLLLASACATTHGAGQPPPERLEFSLPDMAGKNVSPADHLGKVVLVDLWATWCKPCIASFPFYDALLAKHGPAGLVILAVSVDEGDAEVERFLRDTPVRFTVLRDPRGTLPERLDIQTMPSAMIIGRDGGLVKLHAGFRSSDKQEIEQLVTTALARP